MRILLFLFIAALAVLPAAQPAELPIGAIQGAGPESPALNRFVNFRGVVVGRYEDQNTRGDVYYTLFIQDLPGAADADPATSDAVAVFLGREPRWDVELGDVVRVGGKVTEFYGLTEIDDRGLTITVEGEAPLPAPVALDPPAEIAAAAGYFEALEGMRVAFPGEVVVAGPTHEACGFAVVDAAVAAELPIRQQAAGDPIGRAVPILYPSDLDCAGIPQVRTGDRLRSVAGALTYNFDQFKVVIDGAEGLEIDPAGEPALPYVPATTAGQVTLATINLEDYFDTARDTDEEGEPVLTAGELAARQTKFVDLIGRALACPTLVGVQEVEHEALLRDLAAALARPCGFVYDVTHRDSPDARGIDNALLSDPRRARVGAVALRQTCSPVPTGIDDSSIACEVGQEPLFGRPPLEVELTVDGQAYVVYVNHFKSKRGGETETGLERIQQAVYLNRLAAERLAVDADARVIALGDFNDTELSPALLLLTDPEQGGRFTNALGIVPLAERYSYNFGGVVELIDGILLSPALSADIGAATILHANADYPAGWRLDESVDRLPFRATDHDVPWVVLGQWPATPTPAPASPPPPSPSPLPSQTRPPAPSPALAHSPKPLVTPPQAALTPAPPRSSPSAARLPLLLGVATALVLAGVALAKWRQRR